VATEAEHVSQIRLSGRGFDRQAGDDQQDQVMTIPDHCVPFARSRSPEPADKILAWYKVTMPRPSQRNNRREFVDGIRRSMAQLTRLLRHANRDCPLEQLPSDFDQKGSS
jgi:hypothetical protein